jgi:hypothetical protein
VVGCDCQKFVCYSGAIICFPEKCFHQGDKYYYARAYGLGSQCRPNECIFRSGKPRGVGISGGRVYEPGEETGKLVYEQPGNEVDGSRHSKEGSK